MSLPSFPRRISAQKHKFVKTLQQFILFLRLTH